MAKDQTDHLGRVTGTVPAAQTVTGFAVEQGTLDGDDPAVKAALADEKRRAEEGTKRAQRVSDQLAPADSADVEDDDRG